VFTAPRPAATHQAFGIAVLTTTTTGIARIVVFGEPDLVVRSGSSRRSSRGRRPQG
jgi:hypothetical protein